MIFTCIFSFSAYLGEKEEPVRKLPKESPIKTSLLPQSQPTLIDYAGNLKNENISKMTPTTDVTTATKDKKLRSSLGEDKFKMTQQWSQSDPTFDCSVDGKLIENQFNNEEDDYVSAEFDQKMATVEIQKDPSHMVLSTSAYDQSFIDYLWCVFCVEIRGQSPTIAHYTLSKLQGALHSILVHKSHTL